MTLALGLVTLALAAMLLGANLRAHRQQRATYLRVYCLPVGEGDCTLIRTPDHHAVLVDAGSRESVPTVLAALQKLKVTRLDLLVLASSRPESVGGVPGLLAHVPVQEVWDNGSLDAGQARSAALEAVRARHIFSRIARADLKEWIGGRKAQISVLWPSERSAPSVSDSLICRLDYGETGILFLGAAGSAAQDALVAETPERLECDALFSGNASDNSGLSLELLRLAAPSVAVLSGGSRLPPAFGALHRLQAAGAGIWRSDTLGAISLSTDGKEPPSMTSARR